MTAPRTMFRAAWEALDMAASQEEIGAALELLDAAVGELKGDELDVAGLVFERLKLGRGMYGELVLKAETRDLVQEALEEAADGFVYTGSKLLAAQRMSASGLRAVK